MNHHKQGCPALGGYGTADRTCICGAEKPLREDMDARRWARELCALNPGVDEGAAIGWFANAIMCGFDEATRRQSGPNGELATASEGGIEGSNPSGRAVSSTRRDGVLVPREDLAAACCAVNRDRWAHRKWGDAETEAEMAALHDRLSLLYIQAPQPEAKAPICPRCGDEWRGQACVSDCPLWASQSPQR